MQCLSAGYYTLYERHDQPGGQPIFSPGDVLGLPGFSRWTDSGHGLYYCLSSLLQSRAGLYLPQQLAAEEGVLVVGVLLLGALCSWLPAYLTALRSDIVENL